MSLTIFVSDKNSDVRILQWFCVMTSTAGESPCGPLLSFRADEFRQIGWEVVRQHFAEHRTKRLTQEKVPQVFTTRAEKRTLAGQRALKVAEEMDGRIRFMPIEIEKLSLMGLKCLPEHLDQVLPTGAFESDFWTAFDKALEKSISLG